MFREPKEVESILLHDSNVRIWDEYATKDNNNEFTTGVVLRCVPNEDVMLDLEELKEIVEALEYSKNQIIKMSKLT